MMQTFYIGIKGLIIQDGKALLLKRKNSGSSIMWDLPGGRMEEGEHEDQTLLRELQEELPTIKDVKIQQFLSAYKLPRILSDGHGRRLHNTALVAIFKIRSISCSAKNNIMFFIFYTSSIYMPFYRKIISSLI